MLIVLYITKKTLAFTTTDQYFPIRKAGLDIEILKTV